MHATKSHHHQGVDAIGDGLEVTGWATVDDLPEAIEDPGGASRSACSGTRRPTRRSPLIAALVEEARGRDDALRSRCSSRPRRRCWPRSPRAGAEEADAAVARAKAAFPAWRAVAPGRPRAAAATGSPTRSTAAQEELAQLEARNAGKPIGDARGEMGMVVDTFRYYAGAPERTLGDTIPVSGGVAMTFREPLGVVALITPWNFPLTIAAWKLAPALAAGNTVVLKPAELTPLTALAVRADRARGRASPRASSTSSPGRARRAAQRLVEHPDVAKVAFTGSTEVGRSIAAGAAQTIKRVTLELGGKSAEHRVRRRRPRGGRRRGAGRGVRQRRPGLLRALAHPRRAPGARRVHGRAGGGRRGASASATRSTRRPRWAR